MAGIIYLDNAATTQPDPAVIAAMTAALAEQWGNPSSVHERGKQAKMALENARNSIAKLAGCHADEVFFTSGGTEADNWALEGVVAASDNSHNHITVSAFEHHAVLDCAKALDKAGAMLTVVPISSDGYVDVQALEKAIRPETVIVSVMHVNNELGTVQPIEAIGAICKSRAVLFHSDCVQSFGKLPLNFATMPVDMISISAHKIHGPKGIGALIVRRGTMLAQHQHGGSQERGRRTGTENLPGIVGFGKAAELCMQNMQSESARLAGLRDLCERELCAMIPDLIVNGLGGTRAHNILSVRVPGCDGEELLIALDMRGICVSTGAACSAGAHGASHVMTALGLTTEDARSSLRISFGRFSTQTEIEQLIETLPGIVAKQRQMNRAMV
ncbi:MAG: cysteine desulfurase [bacterium]|nr:cysteine desulfurase [bacterium]